MTKSKRIQMTRNKPWRCDNPDAVIVARPTKWGNPFAIGKEGPLGRCPSDQAGAVGMFVDMMHDFEMLEITNYPVDLSELRGKDLACWCALDSPCHADVLLRMANINEMENDNV